MLISLIKHQTPIKYAMSHQGFSVLVVVQFREFRPWAEDIGRGAGDYVGGCRIECIVYSEIYLYLFCIPRTKLSFSLNPVRALCFGKSLF